MVQLRRYLATFFVLCASVILSACGVGQPEKEIVVQTRAAQITIPKANRTCPEIPTLPDPDDPETTQRAIALYLPQIVGVAEHCKSDLRTVVNIADDFNQTAAALNSAKPKE